MSLQLLSTAFENDGFIPDRYSRDQENENPPLMILDVPREALSLALIVEDPDAPGGKFGHWLLWNIPPKTQEMKTGSLPVGAVEGLNSAGENGYIGPCPPDGDDVHHYHFRLSALDVFVSLPPSSGTEELWKAIEGHELESAFLVGLYRRD